MRTAPALIVVASVVGLLTFTERAAAWNGHGHKLTASLAFRQMDPEQRIEIIRILKKHPRFTADFKNPMPDEVVQLGEDAQHEWLFQQAAIWPDLTRDPTPVARNRFNRERWHFINEPVFLSQADRDELLDSIDVNLLKDPPVNNFDDRTMNVIQAIKNSARIVASPTQLESKKAVHICWLFHTIGDLHQPLHSSALFTKHLFPNGDKGGNSIKTQTMKNLHSAWDQSLGTDNDFTACRDHALMLLGETGMTEAAEDAAESLTPETWLDESQKTAREVVYDDNLRTLIANVDRDEGTLSPVPLSENYIKKARSTCAMAAVRAGARIGGTLTLLTSTSTPELAVPSLAAAASAQPTGGTSSNIERRLEALERKIDKLTTAIEDLTEAFHSRRNY